MMVVQNQNTKIFTEHGVTIASLSQYPRPNPLGGAPLMGGAEAWAPGAIILAPGAPTPLQ